MNETEVKKTLFAATKSISRSIVVECLTHIREIDSSNPAASPLVRHWHRKMAKSFFLHLKMAHFWTGRCIQVSGMLPSGCITAVEGLTHNPKIHGLNLGLRLG